MNDETQVADDAMDWESTINELSDGANRNFCNGSTKRGTDGRTYSEHSRSPSYSSIELGLRTKYCAFWSGGQVAQL